MRSNALKVAAAVATGALLWAFVGPGGIPASATHQPANKIAIAGSGLETMEVGLIEGSDSAEVSLGSATLRASSPTDLIFAVTAECALWTDITTIGNDESEAVAAVKVWIELDGEPVAVASDDEGDDAGKVVFCDRAYKRVTMNWDDEDAQIDSYLRTRTANAFNWISLNVGSGIHTIEAKAELEARVTGTGRAQAVVGKRTLVVTPEKLANDATI